MIWDQFFLVLLFAVLNAMLSFFLDFCFNEGNIFDFYYRWLLNDFPNQWLAKPLGLCPYCMNVWLAFGSFTTVAVALSLSWFWIIPFVVISHTFLRLFIKWL